MSEKSISPLLAELIERIVSREDLELEFKAAHGGLPRSVWETVSAFANTNGGWIVLGVDDAAHSPESVGVRDAPQILQDFYNGLRNRQKISHTACGPNDASIEVVDGRDVVVIRVPAAPRRNRPVFINNQPYDGTYVRGYTGDYRCSKPEVDRMMREASDIAADSTILPQFGVDDLDEETVRRYRQRLQNQNSGLPWHTFDTIDLLRRLKAYGRDRETGKEGLTVAGLLLFGTSLAIRDWRSPHRIDYRLTQGNADTRWDDRVLHEGNLLSAFDVIYPRLVAGLPTPFRLEGGRRVDEGPMQVALREALVNLLVHADYAETAASLIVRSPEGFRFRNSGSSRVPERDLLSGDRSDPRNPELVHMFRLVGLAEEAGSGIPQIIQAWRSLGLQLPDISVGTERYEFELVLRHAHLLAEEDRVWLQEVVEDWQEPEQLALVHARHAGYIDNQALRALTGLHPSDATKTLGSLRNRDLLQMIGGGRGARYELGATALDALARTGVTPAPGADFVPQHSGDSETSSGDTLPSSGDSDANSGDNDTHSMNVQQLEEIAAPARASSRLAPALREEIIIELCRVQPLSLQELNSLMDKSIETLRPSIRILIRRGDLEYLYPEQPSHPRQKYLVRDRHTSYPGPEVSGQ